MKIITESPTWFIIFCLVAGALLTWLLYRKETAFNETNVWVRRALMTFRFLFITLLSFLLLTPLIRTVNRQTEKPIIVVAQDNSQSITTNKDSAYYKKDYASQLDKFISELGKQYEVKTIAFGDNVNETADFNFNEKQSDYTKLFDELSVSYANRNVGAYIIAGDGLFNRGSSPLYAELNPKAPVFSIALGDTTVQRDLFIGNVRYNKVAFLNNTFPVEINVSARQSAGESTTLTVKEDSAIVFTKTLVVGGSRFNQLTPVYIDAKKKGIHHYKISISSVPGEITLANNSRDIYVDVRESKEKILIAAGAPHPDIAALKHAIESNQNYEVSVVAGSELINIKPQEYQTIILHELPSDNQPASDLLARLKQSQVAVWYILGAQTNVNAFNNLQTGIAIRSSIARNNDVMPSVNSTFSSFDLSAETQTALQSFPPLTIPFGEYRTVTSASDLLRQKIGSVVTDQPLLTFYDVNGIKNAVLAGEGLWRWKLNDFMLHNNTDAFNEIVTKTIQLLSTHESKSHLRLIAKNSFNENEPVSFDAEVYNDNFELINTPDVSITITNKEGKSFPYVFSKTEKSYTMNAGLFAPGDYRYRASVKIGEKMYSSEGQFNVTALQAELTETVADHQLMYALAQKNGGEMFYPNQLDQLAQKLKQREDIKTVSYSEIKLVDLVNVKWFFFLLLAFISLEWFIRKRNGAY